MAENESDEVSNLNEINFTEPKSIDIEIQNVSFAKEIKRPGYSGIIGLCFMIVAGLTRMGGRQFVETFGFHGDTAGNVYFLLLGVSFVCGAILSIASCYERGDVNRICGWCGIGLTLVFSYVLSNALFGEPNRR